jgi:hypothetical protein
MEMAWETWWALVLSFTIAGGRLSAFRVSSLSQYPFHAVFCGAGLRSPSQIEVKCVMRQLKKINRVTAITCRLINSTRQ